MFNEIEKRSILGFIKKQNVITMKDFESAYENRDEIKIYDDKSLDGSDILVIEKDDQQWYMQSRYNAGKACADNLKIKLLMILSSWYLVLEMERILKD